VKIFKFEKFNFITENFGVSLNENSEFNQYQFGIQPFNMPGYGFAQDSQLSIYGAQDSPYVDQFARSRGSAMTLFDFAKDAMRQGGAGNSYKQDFFLDDISEYKNLKILRIVENDTGNIDVYISFEFNDEEYFGVFKNFNNFKTTKIHSDLIEVSSMMYPYMDQFYFLKLSNYLKNVINKWFIPKKGEYKNLKKDNLVKNSMGSYESIPYNSKIQALGVNIDNNNKSYIVIKYKDNKYTINGNDYYYFNYYFEKI